MRVFGCRCLMVLACLAPVAVARGQVSIPISPTFPSDISGGAQGATLQQSAVFAWLEFIALNWPALTNQRDSADASQLFGAQSGPLVWQTFRSKVEIFNLTSSNAPPGYSPTPPDYGYNYPPSYYYQTRFVPACRGQVAPLSPSWINLDETTQIGLDRMFAGGPAITDGANSAPQQIRFAAKANHVEYDYVAQNKYFLPENKTGPARNNMNAYTKRPPVAPMAPFISFPTGTVEIKSAWRPLNANDNAAHFHVQTVRFYENKGANGTPCYFEQQWGLIGLHIIQKTPTAPAFVYATFEQGENIKQPNGTPVEDLDGNIINPVVGAGPTTPSLSYRDSATAPKVTANGAPCRPNNNLYFRDNQTEAGLTGGGAICVNQRYEAIPSDVIAVNRAAHQSIANYNMANRLINSPWAYYKLVSVQASPFDVSAISPTDPVHGAAVFFQADIAIETNYTLQQFQGRVSSLEAGAGAPTAVPLAGFPPPNVVTPAPGGGVIGVNMGGCMGCHGNAQAKGFDFSFILEGGSTEVPETPSAIQGSDGAKLRNKYLQLFASH